MEIFGKGKSKKSFQDIEQYELQQFACRQAEISYRSKEVLLQKIEQNNQKKLYFNIELPLIRVLADMEKYGIKVALNSI